MYFNPCVVYAMVGELNIIFDLTQLTLYALAGKNYTVIIRVILSFGLDKQLAR